MGKLEGMIKSEIVRLAKREIRKISVPVRSGCPVLEKYGLTTSQSGFGASTNHSQSAKRVGKRKDAIGGSPGRGEGVAFLSPFDPKPSWTLGHHPEGTGHSYRCHRRGSTSMGEWAV